MDDSQQTDSLEDENDIIYQNSDLRGYHWTRETKKTESTARSYRSTFQARFYQARKQNYFKC